MPTKNKAERQARLKVADNAAPAEPKPPTRDELYEQAKAAGIKGASKFTRDQLVDALATPPEPDQQEPAAPTDTLTDEQVRQQVADAGAHVLDTVPDPDTVEGRMQLGDQRIADAAQHYADSIADPDAPKPEEDPAKRTIAATAEQKLLKQWQLDGMKGERPVTPNYDYVAAKYVAGGEGLMPKAKRVRAASTGGGGTSRGTGKRQGRATGPRAEQAKAAKEACGGKRGAGVPISDDDLRAYILQVHAEHPESTCSAEREYAYWCERLVLSKRFNGLWSEVIDGDVQTPADDADADDPAEVAAQAAADAQADDVKPDADDKLAEQVHAAAKAVAKKAAPKQATGAKRGDNLRSTKAPAKAAAAKKQATPISKAAQAKGRSPRGTK